MGPYAVESKQLIRFTLPQGITLEADVYYPQGQGPFPVLLMRQPYGRAIASTVVYAHPRWYASHGYIVVIQDVRGRGSSGGTLSYLSTRPKMVTRRYYGRPSYPTVREPWGCMGFLTRV
jgi:predicted acyl esterase